MSNICSASKTGSGEESIEPLAMQSLMPFSSNRPLMTFGSTMMMHLSVWICSNDKTDQIPRIHTPHVLHQVCLAHHVRYGYRHSVQFVALFL